MLLLGEECRLAAPEAKAALLTEHIQARLYNSDARKTLDALATTPGARRGEVLRAAAAEVGLQRCDFANVLDELAAEAQ